MDGAAFNVARGHPMERENYIDDVKRRSKIIDYVPNPVQPAAQR